MIRFREWLFITALMAMATGMGVWHQQRSKAGNGDPLTSPVRSMLVPAQSGVSSAARSVGDFFYGITHARQLRRSNERLRSSSASIASKDAQIKELQLENQRLRQMLQLTPQDAQNWVSAEVIGAYPEQATLTLSVGANQGIKVGAAVISSGGLVGQIASVEGNSSQVLLTIAQGVSVGGRVQNSRALGICQGKGDNLLYMNYLTDAADIKEGDLVVTSGLSQNYRKGLIIGRIDRVWNDPVYNVKKATVKPASSPDKLEEVFVQK